MIEGFAGVSSIVDIMNDISINMVERQVIPVVVDAYLQRLTVLNPVIFKRVSRPCEKCPDESFSGGINHDR